MPEDPLRKVMLVNALVNLQLMISKHAVIVFVIRAVFEGESTGQVFPGPRVAHHAFLHLQSSMTEQNQGALAMDLDVNESEEQLQCFLPVL